jgi:hypothetical protein
MTTPRPIIAVLAALFLTPTFATDTHSTISKRLDAMLAAEQGSSKHPTSETQAERSTRVERIFTENFSGEFSPSRLAHHDEEDLSDLLRAGSIRSFYSDDPDTLVPMRAVIAELERRNAVRHHHALTLHWALIQFRRFEEASDLAMRHALEVPTLQARRAIFDGGPGRRIWTATAEDRIEEQGLPLGPEIRLVMIAQPHCGFSKRAMAAMSTNPRATAAFAKHALVLVPQSAGVDARAVHRWNVAHPELAMVFVDAETDWPEVGNWETPVFQFLQDGKPAETVVGWPDDSRLETVLRLLDDASAVTAQSVGTDSAKNARTSSSDLVRANGGSESKNVRP